MRYQTIAQRLAALSQAERLLANDRDARLRMAEQRANVDRQYVAMVSKTVAQRCDELALAEMTARSPYAEVAQRPSPEREYWQYIATVVKPAGRQVFADGSFIPLTIEEAGYAGKLFGQLQNRRRAAAQDRDRRVYEASAALGAASFQQGLNIKFSRR
jgi:16S rRNA C1402 N4-methylase RsmH